MQDVVTSSTSSRSRSSSVSRRTISRAWPSSHRDDGRTRAHGCRCWPASGSRHRCAGTASRSPGPTSSGQELVLDDDVAGLAVLADDTGRARPAPPTGATRACRRSRRRTARAGCCRSCRRRRRRRPTRAGVERDRLDRADLVQGERRRARRSLGQARSRAAGRRCRARGTRASTIDAHLVGQRRRVGRVVLRRVGDAETAAEVELAQRESRRRDPRRTVRSTRRAATSKPDVSKICDPMCECRPTSSSDACGADRLHRRERLALGDREPELLVLVRGRDVLVRVRLDSRRDPEQHRVGERREPCAIVGQPVDLDGRSRR